MTLPPDAVVAVDVGGTAIKGAVTLRDGTELSVATVQTPVADGAGAVLDAIGGLIDQLRREAHGRAVVKAIGLIPLGLVDPTAGIALYSANAGWQNLPIRDLVSARSGLRVAIDHDVRAAGLAEAQLGAAKGVSEAVFVSIGTGIAAAVISSGAVVSGARGLSGEIGHVPVVPDGERCACGQRGCTETYASAAALARRYRAAGGATSLPAEGVIAAASAGDPIAQSVYDEAIAALARALVGYILVMDPSLIVLGGGLANAGELLLGPLGTAISDGLAFRTAPDIVTGRFGASAGRVGAALIGWRAVEEDRW